MVAVRAECVRNSGWAGSIRRVDITPYPTRAKAVKAEREAILAEQPLWNIVGKTKAYPRPKPKSSTPTQLCGTLDSLPASYITTLWARIAPILENVPEADLLAFVDDAQRMRDARQ